MGNCGGIDWASKQHDVLIEDPAGEELLAERFGHDEDGVSALCAALACVEVEVVAIERQDGLLVDRLLDAGVRVLALHPNQVRAARDRFRASGPATTHGAPPEWSEESDRAPDIGRPRPGRSLGRRCARPIRRLWDDRS